MQTTRNAQASSGREGSVSVNVTSSPTRPTPPKRSGRRYDWRTRRLTLDFDWPFHHRPPLDALRAVYNAQHLRILEAYRIDATKKGCHVVLYLSVDLTFGESLRMREMFGDDGIRAGLDAFRPPYAAGVL